LKDGREMKFFCYLWLLVGSCSIAQANEVVFEIVAGTGEPRNNGKSGSTGKINIGEPFGVEIGPDGALYVAEVRNHRIRRVDLRAGTVSTVAGCGRRGYSGDGGLAVEAELNEPYEIRFDAAGNMFFVEMKNHIVRRVDGKTKTISTLGGNGHPGFGGDGGPATKALLKNPHSIALERSGAVYIADIGNHRIRRIDPNTGIIDSIAGTDRPSVPRDGQPARGNPILGPRALFIHDDTLWIALREGHSIWRMSLGEGMLHHVAGIGKPGFSGDGGPAADATFNGPKGIAVSRGGDVFVVDTENDAIRRIESRSRVVSTVAGHQKKDSDETPGRETDLVRTLNRPHGICVAPDGSLFIGDTLNHRVVHFHPSGAD
jgi:DNA-binding beta-propeller fold protein YncE